MQAANDPIERDLIAKASEGSRAAFSQLVQPHLPRLMVLAQRMLGSSDEAEDALQNAVASAWMARSRLDPDKPIAAFLTTVTLNKCRDRLRRRKAARLFGLEWTDSVQSVAYSSPGPEAEAVDRDLMQRTVSAIDRLPVHLREVLVLVTVDGRSQADAAGLLGVSEKTVETRIYRARKRLRERLDIF